MQISGIVNNIATGAIGLLVLAGVLVGVGAFQLTQIKASCGLNATGGIEDPLYTACSYAYNMTVNTGALGQNFATQLPTVGTMFGVALILAAIGLIGYGIAKGVQQQ